MKLRLPHKFQAALMAAFASVSFTTLSSGALAAAFFLGNQTFAEDTAEESTDPESDSEIPEFNIGYTDPEASPEESDKQQKIEVDQANIKANEVGSNGSAGNNDGLLLNEDEYNSSDEPALVAVAGSGQQDIVSGTADATPSDNLGFTTNPYATGSDTSNGSDSVFTETATPAAPAAQQLAVETTAQAAAESTSTGTNSTPNGTSGLSVGSGLGSIGGGSFGASSFGAISTPVATGLSVGGNTTPALLGDVGATVQNKVTITSLLENKPDQGNHAPAVSTEWKTNVEGGAVYDFGSGTYFSGLTSPTLASSLTGVLDDSGSGESATTYLTIGAWVNVASLSGEEPPRQSVFSYGNDGTYGLALRVCGNGRLKLTTKGKADFTNSNMTETVNAGEWEFVAITMRKSDTNGKIDVWYQINDSRSESAVTDTAYATTGSDAFSIGSFNAGGASDLMNGSIANLTAFTSSSLLSTDDVMSAVGGMPQPWPEVVWNGTADNHTWQASGVWKDGKTFTDGDNVIFNDTAAEHNVLIQSAITAQYVRVRDNYTFNLSGDASLSASAIEIASGSSLTVNGGTVTTGGLSIASGSSLTVNGGTVTTGGLSGAGALIKTGDGTMTVNSKIGSDYTGSISVSGGTLNIANGADGNYHEVTVTNGGVVDLKGKDNTDYMLHYTLNGGTLTNTGSGTSKSKIQNDQITLTGNSTISGSGNFCMLGSGYGKTELHLDTHTLEKTGTNEITMYSTVVSGGGTLKITNGSLNIKRNGDNNPMSSVNANIVLNRTGADSLMGNFNLAANYSISSTVENAIMSANVALQGATTLEAGESHSLTMSGALTGSGSIIKTGEGTVTLSSTGNSYTGTTTVDGGTLSVAKLGGGAVSVTAGTLDLTATMTTGNLTVGNGATLKLAAAEGALTVNGDLTLNSDSELDVSRLDSLYAAGKTVTLATYTGTGASEGVALTGLGAGHSAYLTNDTTNKALILTFVATLDWNGTETNHTWVAGSGVAWQGGTVFQNGAGVSFSSSTANKEVLIESAIVAGTVTVSEDGYRFAMGSGGSLTADNLYIADNKTLTTTGNLTIRNAMGGEGNNGNLTYAGEGPGTITFQSNDGEHVKEYTGTFTNESKSAVTLKFPESTKSKSFEIHFDIKRAEGAGVVNLDLLKGTQSEADLSVFSSSVEVNDIKHTPNVTVLVREEGALTVTGTVTTGRLVVGQEDTETDAVFTLAGTNAKLNKGGTGSTFEAPVQGYGTLALTEGATETLSGGLLDFHGTYKVSGENSVLTLSSAVASDAKLVAADGGVIKLTATYTMGDNSSVDGGTISVGNGLVVNGTVDLSKGTLAQTGGTVTVNQDKSLTLGNASITSAISNSGSVTFTQNITATGLTGGEKDYRVGIDGQKTTGDNYFAGAKEAYLNVVSGNGTVTIQNAPTVTQGGEVYTLGADGTASRTTQEADYTTFYHGSDALTLSDIAAAAKAHTATLVRVNMSDDTVLTIDDTVATIAVQEFSSAAKAIGTVSLTSEEPDIDKGQSRLLLDGYGTFEIQGTAEVDNAVRFVAGENSTVQIINTDEDASSDQYKLDSNHIYVTADTVQKVGAGDVTVGNVLHGVSKVENTEASGSFTLAYMTRSDNAMDVKAQTGDIQFYGYNADAKVALHDLQIAEGKGVGFYSGYVPDDGIANVANEISVTVTGTLTAGAGAKLNANVDMASGSHLDVSGAQSTMGLLMGSDVTLHSGSYLDIAGCTQEDVSGYLYNYLSSGEHSLYYLYSGTAEDKIKLSINGTQRIDPLTKRSWNDYDMDASTIYANLQAQTFYLVYDGANVGTIVAIGLIPEPTTGTLSLLALAALAARRRRK